MYQRLRLALEEQRIAGLVGVGQAKIAEEAFVVKGRW
jgi:hypothetical protein